MLKTHTLHSHTCTLKTFKWLAQKTKKEKETHKKYDLNENEI